MVCALRNWVFYPRSFERVNILLIVLFHCVHLLKDSQEISFNTELSLFSFDISKTYKIIPIIELQHKDLLNTNIFLQIINKKIPIKVHYKIL
jgi:hypothetical protein